jgi:hypothetical protein
MLLLLTTILAATPVTRTSVRAELDVGGLVGASWYVPAGRERIEAARLAFFSDAPAELSTYAYALPVVGPMMTTRLIDDGVDRALLITTSLLQTLGLTMGAAWLFQDRDSNVIEAGPLISISPIAAGRLGLSLRVTGF